MPNITKTLNPALPNSDDHKAADNAQTAPDAQPAAATAKAEARAAAEAQAQTAPDAQPAAADDDQPAADANRATRNRNLKILGSVALVGLAIGAGVYFGAFSAVAAYASSVLSPVANSAFGISVTNGFNSLVAASTSLASKVAASAISGFNSLASTVAAYPITSAISALAVAASATATYKYTHFIGKTGSAFLTGWTMLKNGCSKALETGKWVTGLGVLSADKVTLDYSSESKTNYLIESEVTYRTIAEDKVPSKVVKLSQFKDATVSDMVSGRVIITHKQKDKMESFGADVEYRRLNSSKVVAQAGRA